MNYLIEKNYVKHVLVFMSSGNFGGIDWEIIKSHLLRNFNFFKNYFYHFIFLRLFKGFTCF